MSCACSVIFAAAGPAAGQPVGGEAVLFLKSAEVAAQPISEFGGAPGRVLSRDSSGRRVLVVELPAGWRHTADAAGRAAIELLVLSGELRWDAESLVRHDHGYLPPAAAAPDWSAPVATAVLVFFDPPRPTDGGVARITHSAELKWRPGVVAQQDTGLALKLEVKDLLWVESTGQRTWLLRSGPDLEVPWERHDGVEEGFLLEGRYRLAECLAAGAVVEEYTPGGYFYRPGGIVHSGPESGSDDEVLWLLRTPTRLTVEFLPNCEPPRSAAVP